MVDLFDSKILILWNQSLVFLCEVYIYIHIMAIVSFHRYCRNQRFVIGLMTLLKSDLYDLIQWLLSGKYESLKAKCKKKCVAEKWRDIQKIIFHD